VIALGPLDVSAASTIFSSWIVDAENFRAVDPEPGSMARLRTGISHAADSELGRLRLCSVASIADRPDDATFAATTQFARDFPAPQAAVAQIPKSRR
jgi:hypothetical protein